MNILIWGGRSKARIILRMIEDIFEDGFCVKGIFDPTLSALPFKSDIPLFSKKTDLKNLIGQCSHYIVCIGGEHGYARYMTARKLDEQELKPLSIVSSRALLDDLDALGVGAQSMPGSIVHKFSKVGDHCIFNTNSTVDHECTIGNGVHIMGGAAVAGRVTIGDFSTIGTNATILPNINIGKNVYVGAGAVVIKDVEDGVVVAGVPSRTIKRFEPRCDLSCFDP